MSKNYRFENGVEVEINESKITLSDGNSKKTLHSENIDNFSYTDYMQQRLSPFAVTFRFHALSFVLIGVVLFAIDGFNAIHLTLIAIIVLVNIVVFWGEFFDAIFEFNILRYIVDNFFSDEAIYVTIGNKSGNNLEFLVYPEEQNKVKLLEKTVEALRIHKNAILQPNHIKPTSNLDDLEKLGDLFKKGILTKKEFESKKQEMLK